ncbi:MAG: Ig-like domain-containing protein [Anaerolineae bacterium]|nr:Ig-like domain-containing protein [Anaerolineae bacterium]
MNLESTYVVNIAPTALSAAGEAALLEGQSASFATVPMPGVRETMPVNGTVGVPLWQTDTQIQFRSPMNTNTFEGRIAIDPEPEQWTPYTDEGGMWLTLIFNKKANTTYTITLQAGMEDIYGNAIPTDYIFSYTTAGIETNAELLRPSQLVTTGAYREDTRIPIIVSGAPTVDFALHRLDLANLQDAVSGGY